MQGMPQAIAAVDLRARVFPGAEQCTQVQTTRASSSLFVDPDKLALPTCLQAPGGRAGARARWCGHSPLLCSAALRGQKTAASSAAVFKWKPASRATRQQQLTHAAADRTRTMPRSPEASALCTKTRRCTNNEQQRQLGKPMHAPTQGVLNFYTYVPTLCTQLIGSFQFFSLLDYA